MSDDIENTNEELDMSGLENMTDEELMNISDADMDSMFSNEEIDTNEEEFDTEVEDTEEEYEDEYEDEDDSEEELDEESDEEEYEEDEDEDEDSEEDEDEDESEDKEEVTKDEEDSYKTKYEELLAPIKANKKIININSPEDLRRLAQKGVDYQNKMIEIKPLRKIGKMLENEGLLDEEKLNFLIDISKNDPKAIQKLLKDSNIDPLDLDTESTTDYKPNTYNVNDNQLNLTDTLADLEQTESGREVIDLVGNKWDESSRDILTKQPTLMVALAGHMDDGSYEKVMGIINTEKALGNIPSGVTDLQAYNHIYNQVISQGSQTPTDNKETVKVTGKPNRRTEKNRAKRRKSATATRSNKTKITKAPKDTQNLSDEEFEKFFNKNAK